MQNRDDKLNARFEDRLETASAIGYRHGMSAPSVIAQRLGRLYNLPNDMPGRFREALQRLDRKVCAD